MRPGSSPAGLPFTRPTVAAADTVTSPRPRLTAHQRWLEKQEQLPVLSKGVREVTGAQTMSSRVWLAGPSRKSHSGPPHDPFSRYTDTNWVTWDFTNSSPGQFTPSCKLPKK